MTFNTRFLWLVAPLFVSVAACSAAPAEEGDLETGSSEDPLTNAQTSKIYSCASNALWTIAGAADMLVCGTAAVPSGGLTVACYVIGAGATGAGALAYCGAECPGAHSVCPGYDDGLPSSFRETSRSKLVSRCVGTVRYSHWPGRPEFENGTCICRQSCPTP
ncbi:MAG TPA: hypothetical protein VLT33_43225 [Labilithrix sp.]|nr:hypothetical protein [Labilithrix sp.]